MLAILRIAPCYRVLAKTSPRGCSQLLRAYERDASGGCYKSAPILRGAPVVRAFPPAGPRAVTGADAPLLPPLPGQRGPAAPRGHRLQPRQSLAPAGLAPRHPKLVPSRACSSGRSRPVAGLIRHARYLVLQLGRELLDIGSVSAHPRAPRATRVAPNVIESPTLGRGP